jgi:hypothetical protein
MAKVFPAIRTIILRSFEKQSQQLIALSRVLQGPPVGRFNLEPGTTTVNTIRSARWSGLDLNIALSINRIDLEFFYA